MPTQDTRKATVAYVPFKTFLNAIETLAQHGLPEQIDSSVWSHWSGATTSQLLIALRFLGLITADGKATTDLEKLVNDKANRKTNLLRILQRSYPQLSKSVTKMTPTAFSSAMAKEFKAEGETQKKAKSFFLQAARYAELPLSSFLLNQTRRVSPRKRRASPPAHAKGVPIGDIHGVADNQQHASTGPTKTIKLQNGITLTLSASSDVFKMNSDDREFVNRVLKEMEDYEFNTGNSN